MANYCYLSAKTIASFAFVLLLALNKQTDAGLFTPINFDKGLVGGLSSTIGKASDKLVNTAKAAPKTVVETAKAAPGEVVDTAKNVGKQVAEKLGDYVDIVKDGIELNCLGFPKGPLSAALESILSSKTDPEDVRFYFTSRAKPNYTTIHVKHFTLQDTDFDIRRETFVLTHGFLSHGHESWLRNMADALLHYVS